MKGREVKGVIINSKVMIKYYYVSIVLLKFLIIFNDS